jgi:hypothetical protein
MTLCSLQDLTLKRPAKPLNKRHMYLYNEVHGVYFRFVGIAVAMLAADQVYRPILVRSPSTNHGQVSGREILYAQLVTSQTLAVIVLIARRQLCQRMLYQSWS